MAHPHSWHMHHHTRLWPRFLKVPVAWLAFFRAAETKHLLQGVPPCQLHDDLFQSFKPKLQADTCVLWRWNIVFGRVGQRSMSPLNVGSTMNALNIEQPYSDTNTVTHCNIYKKQSFLVLAMFGWRSQPRPNKSPTESISIHTTELKIPARPRPTCQSCVQLELEQYEEVEQ